VNQADGWREFPDLEADDLEADDLEGTGYMCTGCAMPAEPGGLSACCGMPVVDSD
jgi:hypothetical protein